MRRRVIRVSVAEAAKDLSSVLTQVGAGADVILERDTRPVAVIRNVSDSCPPRSLSESIAIAKTHAKELGYTPTLDPEFAADIEPAINTHREPLNPPAWD